MSEKDPWTRHERRQIYDNPWIRVAEDRVTDPSGAPGIYGTVHFKNHAVGIIPLAGNGDTWLIGQYRYPLELYSWEIPMGGAPRGEAPLDAAKRELREETGLTAARWEKILAVHVSNCITDEAGFVFTAEELAEGEPEFDSTEDLAIRRLPFADALAMAMDGEITDLLSVAGLLKVGAMRPGLGRG